MAGSSDRTNSYVQETNPTKANKTVDLHTTLTYTQNTEK